MSATKPAPQSKKSRIVKLTLKSVFVFGLLYFLLKNRSISIQDTQHAFTRWEDMGPAFLLMFVNLFLGAIRWHWLLQSQNIRIQWARTLQLAFIGNFFNIALPGAVSGDFVKAFYIGRETGGKKGRAFGSILFDRVAGLSALVLISAAAAWFGHSALPQPLISGTRHIITLASVCVISFYGYLFLVREHHDPVLKLLKTIEKKAEKMGSLVRIYEGLRHYHNHRVTVLKVLGVSMVIHLLVGWACFKFAHALGEEAIPLLALYVTVPLGLLVTAIPIAPAGVGTGHFAFAWLFNLIPSARGADVFTLFVFATLVLGSLGGLVYLRFRAHEPKPDFQSAETDSLPLA